MITTQSISLNNAQHFAKLANMPYFYSEQEMKFFKTKLICQVFNDDTPIAIAHYNISPDKTRYYQLMLADGTVIEFLNSHHTLPVKEIIAKIKQYFKGN